MELCSLEDAFPEIAKKGDEKGATYPSKEERRAARKKAKKCKGPALDYVEMNDGKEPDPDRPAVKRLGEVPAFVPLSEAFPDLSGATHEGFKLPTLPKASCLSSDQGLPDYFGKGLDDDAIEGFQTLSDIIPKGIVDAFSKRGVGKAGSEGEGSDTLPAPNLVDAWKPITPAKTTTSYFKSLPTAMGAKKAELERIVKASSGSVKEEPAPEEAPPIAKDVAPELASRDALLSKINDLTKRLDDMEKRAAPRNTQQELLMFVGAGLFLLVSFDIVVRATR